MCTTDEFYSDSVFLDTEPDKGDPYLSRELALYYEDTRSLVDKQLVVCLQEDADSVVWRVDHEEVLHAGQDVVQVVL